MTVHSILSKTVLASVGFSVAMLSVSPALAQYGGQQPQYPPQSSYPSGPYPQSPQYPNRPYQNGQYSPQSNDYDRTPPPGYDGRENPPPPPGYQPGPNDQQIAQQDRYYADRAQRWAQDNCVKSHGDSAGGALLGGLLGAIIGHSVGSRGDRGTATVAGAVIGGVGGAAIASSSNGRTSPGCPPGYVLRRSAQPYYFESDYVYAAPGWYHPWFFYGGRWEYRPYPYHDYYARQYRGYGHPEWHDRGWHDHDEYERDHH